MFDWLVELLYLLTKSICKLIDGLIDCTDYLCGIKEVTINDEETDLMTWLLSQKQILDGFKIAVLVGFTLVIFFSIWKIVKVIVDEKPEGTPGQICIKAFKTILTFLFVPAIMIALVWAMNAIGTVMYSATKGGSTTSMGQFLVGCFAQDARREGIAENFYANPPEQQMVFDYKNTDSAWQFFNLWDFDYFYSWVAGIAILFSMFKILMIFVDRMFSIVLLYMIAPIPIASSIVDEGQHFKQWREQILAKFCVGYGAIMGLNIYTLVTGQLATADIKFFGNSFIDWLFKLVIILGGAMAVNRIIGMIGNLVSNGAGDNELKAGQGMWSGVKGLGKSAAALAGKGISGVKGLFSKGKQDGENASSGGSSEGGGEGSAPGGGESPAPDTGNKNPAMGSKAAASQGQGAVAASNPYVAAGMIAANAIQDKKEDDNKNQNNNQQNKGSSNSPVGQIMNQPPQTDTKGSKK